MDFATIFHLHFWKPRCITRLAKRLLIFGRPLDSPAQDLQNYSYLVSSSVSISELETLLSKFYRHFSYLFVEKHQIFVVFKTVSQKVPFFDVFFKTLIWKTMRKYVKKLCSVPFDTPSSALFNAENLKSLFCCYQTLFKKNGHDSFISK